MGIDEIRKYEFPDPHGIYDIKTVPDVVKKQNGMNRYFILMEGRAFSTGAGLCGEWNSSWWIS
jgi:hypothetical protein